MTKYTENVLFLSVRFGSSTYIQHTFLKTCINNVSALGQCEAALFCFCFCFIFFFIMCYFLAGLAWPSKAGEHGACAGKECTPPVTVRTVSGNKQEEVRTLSDGFPRFLESCLDKLSGGEQLGEKGT